MVCTSVEQIIHNSPSEHFVHSMEWKSSAFTETFCMVTGRWFGVDIGSSTRLDSLSR